MQYMFLIYLDENSLSESERARCYEESAAYAQELHASGKRVLAAPLQPTGTARSVRRRGEKRVVIDGPFTEAKEALGGFFLVDAKDMDEAKEIAQKIPAGRWGGVEIRPLLEIPGLPQS